MPLSSSIMRRIWPKEVRATVFHVTDDVGYDKIRKLQNKKASISSSREQIILKVGDWTLPADFALGTCLHKRGLTLNPIK